MKHFIATAFLSLFFFSAFSQAKVRKLPPTINHPAINVYAPYMSFDGDALVYVSDNAEDYVLTPFFTYREGSSDWKEPVVLPRLINTRLNFLKGYTLSPDGKVLYISSMKSPGVGGYDIVTSERRGTNWTEPKNLGAPINTRSHEACATLTPDNKTLYFMRCDQMDQKGASGCKIFRVNKKSNGQWEEPVELPANINTGNSQTPRILADAETLIFSSDKFAGNKGGMDLYITKYQNGEWSNPRPLTFINTDKDDQYVSVNGLGRYLLRDSPGARKSELVEYLIPAEFRPRGLMRVDGKVTGAAGENVPCYISVVDLNTGKRIFNGRPSTDGSYTLFLLEGSTYELSIDPEQSNVSFFSKRFDLTTEQIPQFEKLSSTLKLLAPGDEVPLSLIQFKPSTSELSPSSYEDLKRAARLIKSNPSLKYELQVMLAGYEEDSVRSNADLTEMQVDSIPAKYQDIDSLGQLYQRDTVIARVRYHNDRTAKQAQTVIAYLVSQGVEEGMLSYFINARPEAVPDKKKTEVRLRVKK